MLTVAQVEQALPANLKGAATQEFTDKINKIVNDPVMAEHIRENFLSYVDVLRDGRFKTEDYLHAVAYVSYKLIGNTNVDAYAKVFPQRYALLVANGASSKDISAYVSAYNKGKLVNMILEQSLVPTWVLNAHLHQKAINVQASLMMTANSEKVRSDAANSLLTHLAKPKDAGPLVNINMKETSGMTELKEMLERVALQQQDAIKSGVSTHTIAAQPLIEGSAKEVVK